MELSAKAIRYLIDALKNYEENVDRRLHEAGSLSDDEIADLTNDRQYLSALRQDLQAHHEELLNGREVVRAQT